MTGNDIYRYIVFCFMFISLSFATGVRADVASDMSDFWKNSGGNYNITNPGSYKSQSGGYVTLGGMQARSPIRSVSLANISLPSARSGCGGIDIYSGGFSFINSQQLVQSLKAVAQNAVGYSFKLALENLSPTISGVMSKLQTTANKVNRFNINSCQQAKMLVGSFWAKNKRTSQIICEDIGTAEGLFSDRARAVQGCSTGGQHNSTIKSAKGALKEKISWDTNIAWKILRKNPTFAKNDRLAELAMSLTGTIIPLLGKGDNSTNTVKRFKSLGLEETKNDIFNALMYGTKGNVRTEVYTCAEKKKCLSPYLIPMDLSNTVAFVPKVRDMLLSIQAQLEQGCSNTADDNKCFSNEEHALIENTSFPLYKLLNAYSVFGQSIGASPTSYTDVVAFDMVFNYIKNIIGAVVKETAKDISDSATTKEYIRDLEKVQANLRGLYAKKMRSLSMTLDMVQRIEMIDKRVRADLSAVITKNLDYESANDNK